MAAVTGRLRLATVMLCAAQLALARVSQVPHSVSAAVDAKTAAQAAETAQNAAAQAQRVAERSVDVAARAHEALDHAHDAVVAARVEAQGLSSQQEDSLRKAEAKLRSAKKLAEYGSAPDAQPVGPSDEVAGMQDDLRQLREKLAQSGGGRDKSMEQMDQELRELQGMLKKLEDEQRRQGQAPKDTPVSKELKVEIQHLRDALNRLDKFGKVTARLPEKMERDPETGELRYRVPLLKAEARVQLTPLVDLDVGDTARASVSASKPIPSVTFAAARAPAPPVPAPPTKRVDIDTDMPYGEIEPFGREDTAQELTEASIRESNRMVDQLERAEVAEEKRAVFRALTRLRGAAIASYDGVARAQTGNIDEYNKINKWRKSHPLEHLADQESDVTKWAFPNNADFL